MKKIIIFDFNRTLYDPEVESLNPDAIFVLKTLQKRGFEFYLVSRKERNRKNLIKKLGIRPYFKRVIITRKKNEELFRDILSYAQVAPRNSFVIGDRTQEEIFLGNKCGMKTIWFKTGRFANELPKSKDEEPTYIVRRLKEIIRIVACTQTRNRQ
ncbi:HAD hydrolase-like protein [Patescibacteria group bacterium]|nr:HAD hydrolase-like protein [Patescibacteria group bacterium]